MRILCTVSFVIILLMSLFILIESKHLKRDYALKRFHFYPVKVIKQSIFHISDIFVAWFFRGLYFWRWLTTAAGSRSEAESGCSSPWKTSVAMVCCFGNRNRANDIPKEDCRNLRPEYQFHKPQLTTPVPQKDTPFTIQRSRSSLTY